MDYQKFVEVELYSSQQSGIISSGLEKCVSSCKRSLHFISSSMRVIGHIIISVIQNFLQYDLIFNFIKMSMTSRKSKMRNLFEGGQCNPNVIGQSNQYKAMMENLKMGDKNAEKVMTHGNQGQNLEGNIYARQAMFEQMGKGWQMSQSQMMAQQREMQKMMGRQFNQAQIQNHKQRMHMMQVQQMEMRNAQQMARMNHEKMMSEFQRIEIEKSAQMWKNQITMEKVHEQATVNKEAQQESILNSSSSMLDVMMNDPDPRFQNSQFLHFLKRIQDKEVIIQGKQIKQVKPDVKLMEKNWENAENKYEQNLKTMEVEHKSAEKKYEENWQQRLEDFEKEYSDHENFEKMLEDKYMEVLKEMNLDLTEAWQNATDLEEELVHGDVRQTYIFSQKNPFLNEPQPKLLALNFINSGKNNEAILALEAHIQKNMEDSDSWRILGRILQQNDQDQKSITCFMNSIKHNSQNLDSLLSLGVSCTNILDEVKAMNFLKRWIILNPKYKHLGVDPNIIPDNETDFQNYKIDDIKMMNDRLIEVFEKTTAQYQNDPELFNALAILYFVKRDYDRAIDLFKRALDFDPTNYLLMNKVGAALAHLGRADEAKEFYHRALDIRPNYVRVWVNLGIAHGFKGDYEEAARFYLNSLSFRPDAKHVWSYLHTTFMNMQRYDLINEISKQDPRVFGQFDVIDLNQLPQPSINYKITTQKHILNKESSGWLNEFKK